ncbi:unnamed protein product [Cylicocyclus nassatus]|uniref:Uncharacterized protein n=1 Tax=Cylicocyclus nassatus TaxID=53992 RepID=A0AA36DRP2_CYLNA|nr:unnamed protein product [Cylicocyclus nassatus]
MSLLSSKLLVFVALLIIVPATNAEANKKCNARWKAYGFDESLNDVRRNKVQEVIRQKQGVVKYACEHEQIAAKIRDEVLEDDPTFTYGIDLVFAAKEKFKISEEVTFFPE